MEDVPSEKCTPHNAKRSPVSLSEPQSLTERNPSTSGSDSDDEYDSADGVEEKVHQKPQKKRFTDKLPHFSPKSPKKDKQFQERERGSTMDDSSDDGSKKHKRRKGLMDRIRKFGSREELDNACDDEGTKKQKKTKKGNDKKRKNKHRQDDEEEVSVAGRWGKGRRRTLSDGSSSSDEEFAKQAVVAANRCRRKHGVKKLKPSKELNARAHERARMLARDKPSMDSKDENFGTNIFSKNVGSSHMEEKVTAEEVIATWYREIDNFEFEDEPVNPHTIRNATQLLWMSSKSFGIGKSRSANREVVFVAAYFFPSGNSMGEYIEQVPPLGGFNGDVGDLSLSDLSSSSSEEENKNDSLDDLQRGKKKKKKLLSHLFGKFMKHESNGNKTKQKDKQSYFGHRQGKYILNDSDDDVNEDEQKKRSFHVVSTKELKESRKASRASGTSHHEFPLDHSHTTENSAEEETKKSEQSSHSIIYPLKCNKSDDEKEVTTSNQGNTTRQDRNESVHDINLDTQIPTITASEQLNVKTFICQAKEDQTENVSVIKVSARSDEKSSSDSDSSHDKNDKGIFEKLKNKFEKKHHFDKSPRKASFDCTANHENTAEKEVWSVNFHKTPTDNDNLNNGNEFKRRGNNESLDNTMKERIHQVNNSSPIIINTSEGSFKKETRDSMSHNDYETGYKIKIESDSQTTGEAKHYVKNNKIATLTEEIKLTTDRRRNSFSSSDEERQYKDLMGRSTPEIVITRPSVDSGDLKLHESCSDDEGNAESKMMHGQSPISVKSYESVDELDKIGVFAKLANSLEEKLNFSNSNSSDEDIKKGRNDLSDKSNKNNLTADIDENLTAKANMYVSKPYETELRDNTDKCSCSSDEHIKNNKSMMNTNVPVRTHSYASTEFCQQEHDSSSSDDEKKNEKRPIVNDADAFRETGLVSRMKCMFIKKTDNYSHCKDKTVNENENNNENNSKYINRTNEKDKTQTTSKSQFFVDLLGDKEMVTNSSDENESKLKHEGCDDMLNENPSNKLEQKCSTGSSSDEEIRTLNIKTDEVDLKLSKNQTVTHEHHETGTRSMIKHFLNRKSSDFSSSNEDEQVANRVGVKDIFISKSKISKDEKIHHDEEMINDEKKIRTHVIVDQYGKSKLTAETLDCVSKSHADISIHSEEKIEFKEETGTKDQNKFQSTTDDCHKIGWEGKTQHCFDKATASEESKEHHVNTSTDQSEKSALFAELKSHFRSTETGIVNPEVADGPQSHRIGFLEKLQNHFDRHKESEESSSDESVNDISEQTEKKLDVQPFMIPERVSDNVTDVKLGSNNKDQNKPTGERIRETTGTIKDDEADNNAERDRAMHFKTSKEQSSSDEENIKSISTVHITTGNVNANKTVEQAHNPFDSEKNRSSSSDDNNDSCTLDEKNKAKQKTGLFMQIKSHLKNKHDGSSSDEEKIIESSGEEKANRHKQSPKNPSKSELLQKQSNSDSSSDEEKQLKRTRLEIDVYPTTHDEVKETGVFKNIRNHFSKKGDNTSSSDEEGTNKCSIKKECYVEKHETCNETNELVSNKKMKPYVNGSLRKMCSSDADEEICKFQIENNLHDSCKRKVNKRFSTEETEISKNEVMDQNLTQIGRQDPTFSLQEIGQCTGAGTQDDKRNSTSSSSDSEDFGKKIESKRQSVVTFTFPNTNNDPKLSREFCERRISDSSCDSSDDSDPNISRNSSDDIKQKSSSEDENKTDKVGLLRKLESYIKRKTSVTSADGEPRKDSGKAERKMSLKDSLRDKYYDDSSSVYSSSDEEERKKPVIVKKQSLPNIENKPFLKTKKQSLPNIIIPPQSQKTIFRDKDVAGTSTSSSSSPEDGFKNKKADRPLRNGSLFEQPAENIKTFAHEDSDNLDYFVGNERECKEGESLEPTKFVEEIMTAINYYRNKHHAQSLVLDEQLCDFALERAKIFASGVFGTLPSDLGEITFSFTSDVYFSKEGAEFIVDSWYRRIVYHSFDDATEEVDFKPGPFTQLVWKGSHRAGIGWIEDRRERRTILVAIFSPSGNIRGQFGGQVEPRKTTSP